MTGQANWQHDDGGQLGQDAQAVCQDLLERYLGSPDLKGRELLAAAEAVLEQLNQRLRLLLGARGVAAVAQRAIRLTRGRHPDLELVKVNDTGVSFEQLADSPAALDGPRLHDAVNALLNAELRVTASLIGEDLVLMILRRVSRDTATLRGTRG